MGMFDTIVYGAQCPVNGVVSEVGIQVKWLGCELSQYKIGDFVGFGKNMSNLWIREEYDCSECKFLMDEKYPGWRISLEHGGYQYNSVDNCPNGRPDFGEYNHNVFVNIKKGKISDIISENEFKKKGLEDFLSAYEL